MTTEKNAPRAQDTNGPTRVGELLVLRLLEVLAAGRDARVMHTQPRPFDCDGRRKP